MNVAAHVPDWRKDILRWGVDQELECELWVLVSAKAITTVTQEVESSLPMLLIGKNEPNYE